MIVLNNSLISNKGDANDQNSCYKYDFDGISVALLGECQVTSILSRN